MNTFSGLCGILIDLVCDIEEPPCSMLWPPTEALQATQVVFSPAQLGFFSLKPSYYLIRFVVMSVQRFSTRTRVTNLYLTA